MSAQLEIDHAGWCTDHRTEVDGHEVIEVCRRAVTFGEATVDIEDSPAWADDDLPIVPPIGTPAMRRGRVISRPRSSRLHG